VHQLPLEVCAAAPAGDHGVVLVTGRDHDLPRTDHALGRIEIPAAVLTIDALHARAELQVDPVLARVALEVLD
jgi:hypothetical protein